MKIKISVILLIFIISFQVKIISSNGDTLPVSPIFIDNNSGFLANGFTGSGTQASPYILENVNITTSNSEALHIRDTTAYFVVRNSLFDTQGTTAAPVNIWNVRNGQFENITVLNSGLTGMVVYNALNLNISNSIFRDNAEDGVHIDSSQNVRIDSSIIYDNMWSGLRVEYSTGIEISDCVIHDNGQDNLAITVLSDSKIIRNDITGSVAGTNLHTNGLEYSLVDGNRIYGHETIILREKWGFIIESSSYNVITNNEVFNHEWSYLSGSSTNNEIAFNQIFSNINGLIVQDFATDNNIHNNTFTRNNFGLIVSASENVIESNTFNENLEASLFLTGLNLNNQILNNEFVNNQVKGISFWETSNNTASQNVFIGNTQGINLFYSSNNKIFNNTFTNHKEDGITFEEGNYNNEISANTISGSLLTGINFYHINPDPSVLQYGNIITHNLIYQNPGESIILEVSTEDSIIQYNDIAKIPVDNGGNNFFNHNFYSTHTSGDPVHISGTSNSVDQTPSTHPNHMIVGNLTVYVNFTLIMEGDVLITWDSFDDNLHDYSYSLYYSIDVGKTWSNIISGLKVLNHTLDSNLLPSGREILIKLSAIDDLGFEASVISSDNYLVLNELHQVKLDGFITPSGGETVVGPLEIRWHTAESNWGREFTYNLFYSSDKSGSWKQLAIQLSSTSYTWDTSEVDEGLYYLKIVAIDIYDGESYEAILNEGFAVVHAERSDEDTDNLSIPGFEFAITINFLVCAILIKRRGYKSNNLTKTS